MLNNKNKQNILLDVFGLFGFLGVVFLSGFVLASNNVSADVVDRVSITVPVACTLEGTGMNSHNAEIQNGTYTADIGTTTLHAFCNDSEGFAIYAVGYTGNELGEVNSNKLVGTSASNNAAIDTGLATSAGSPDVSNWAMKIAMTQDSGDTTGTNVFTIDSAPNVTNGADASFSQYHVVPNRYTKVAHKNSGTDMTAVTGGVKLTTTYAAYISKTQPADTYSGQVKYTLVHPSDHSAPVTSSAQLDTGRTVNTKMRSLAATVVGGEETTINLNYIFGDDEDFYENYDEYIKSISVHLNTSAPSGFVSSEANTVSASTSKKPIYIDFDNTDDAGIMHFYTEGEQIVLPADASFMFYMFFKLSDLSAISSWDASDVTDMGCMFDGAGYSASTFVLDLSSWDTSNVTDMNGLFAGSGLQASTWSIGDLSSWDTSNVADMNAMFNDAGFRASTWSIGDLSSWDTSNVTDMSHMFNNAGASASIWSIGNLSSWDTSNVTNMSGMFELSGYHASVFSLDLSSWDTSNVTNMSGMFLCAGYNASVFSLDLSSWDTSNVTSMKTMFNEAGYNSSAISFDLSSWNTSNVTDMSGMFRRAGYSASTFTLDLSSWDVSKVTSMREMFSRAGYSASTFILDISSWNTSNVTDMFFMFEYAGCLATTWSVTIPQTNGNNIGNTTSRLYGKTTSAYVAPPSDRFFTLAQP